MKILAISLGFALILLGLIFITLKLAGCVAWGWWIVTAPFWAPSLCGPALLVGIAFVAVVSGALLPLAMLYRLVK